MGSGFKQAMMNWFGRLISELRRRRVFRMTAFYIIGSWVALQVADLLFPALDIAEGALRYVWIAIVAGFPLAVFFSWRYDIGADGITRTPPADDTPSETLRLRRTDYAVLVILLGIAVFTVSTMTRHVLEEQAAIDVAPETRDINPLSIAVLPLENLNPQTTEQYFVSGMHDSLISSLGRVSSLQVTSRTSARRVNTSQGISQVGRALGVASVVEGSVFRDGNQVRISIKLIDAASDQHIWSETYEQPFDSVMAIQASVARSVARVIEAHLTSVDEEQLARSLQIRPATFEAYLRAMFQFHKETQEGYQRGIEILEEALAEDPTSALAYAALGQGYMELVHSLLPKSEAASRAKVAADKAIELDPTLAEAHLARGLYQWYGEWNFKAAQASVDRALELNPSLADAWYHKAWFLEQLGDDDEAIIAGEKTVELSPLSNFYRSWLAEQYRDAGEYDKALNMIESVLALNPNEPLSLYALGNLRLEQSLFEEAIAAHEKIAHLPFYSFALGQTLAWAGETDKALEVVQAIEHTTNYALPLIIIYSALGHNDEAVYWMEQARDARIPWYLPMFNWFTAPRSLHEDPRVQALAKETGLPLVPFPKR